MAYNKEERYMKEYFDTGDTEKKEQALNELRNIIYHNVQKFNKNKVLNTKSLFYKALGLAWKKMDKWDPKKSRLSTYVTNQIKPILRDVYRAPILKTPEHEIKNWQKLQSIMTEYESEYGSINYDPIILADMSGLSVKNVKKLLKSNRKTYDTSTVATTNVKWPSMHHKFSLELLETDFNKNTLKRKVWKEIRKALDNGDKPNASTISNKIGKPYMQVNKTFKEITQKINNIVKKTNGKQL